VTIPEGLGLGALQGLTEFLPVSSSGHSVLARALFRIEEAPVTMEVLLHAASAVAILVFFRREIVSLLTTRRRLVLPLVVGTLPAVVIGLLFKDRLEGLFQNPTAVGIGLLFTGTVLWVSEGLASDSRSLDGVSVADGFWVGVAQAIALVPGVSRSGMTVGAGLASGLERGAAVAFAFLLGLIAIAGATALKLRKIVDLGSAGLGPLAAGFCASLVVSLAALSLLTLLVRRKRLWWFTIYCYLVGASVLLAKLAGVW